MVFQLSSNDPEYIRLGTAYTQWRFVGIVSMVTTAAYKAFFDGTGRTYVHFVAAIVMNVVNVFLCWLLMFGGPGRAQDGRRGRGHRGRDLVVGRPGRDGAVVVAAERARALPGLPHGAC